MSYPDEDLLAGLLFWRDAKLVHIQTLDDAHFVDDAAKSDLFKRVIPRLIRERTPDVVSLMTQTRSRAGADYREDVLVTVVGATFVRMTCATVQRRVDAPPLLGAWQPFPDSPDLEVKSWINDALQSALDENAFTAPTLASLPTPVGAMCRHVRGMGAHPTDVRLCCPLDN
jgi:hypothetical protein